MRQSQSTRGGFARLEALLVLATLAFLFQVFPSLWFALVWALDVRNWSGEVWLTLNVGVVVALFGLRFGPGLHSEWREWRAKLAIEREKLQKEKALKEQREMLERLKAGRARRLY